MPCPTEIRSVFEERFHFPTKVLFAVVATRRDEEVNSRMMRVYDIDEKGDVILLTHTGSKKWSELKSSPLVSLCFVSDDKLTQVVLRGKAILETKKNAPKSSSHYWQQIRSDVKEIYNPDYPLEQEYQQPSTAAAPEEVPETSGSVRIESHFWEVLQLVVPYTDSHRFQFHPSASGWSKKRMNLG